jgi:hypothetical protein
MHFIKLERFELRDKKKEVIKTENQLKSLQSVGQLIGEVLKELSTEKCNLFSYLKILSSLPVDQEMLWESRLKSIGLSLLSEQEWRSIRLP